MNRAMILGIIGTLSLLWGLYDLRRKDVAKTPTARAQSWAQILAGLVALYFSFLGWKL